MEIRGITPGERVTASKIQTIAFLFCRDFSKEQENTAPSEPDYETCRAAFNDEGKMCSCLELIPFEVSFDGGIVKSGGVGGVASLPEERQKRYIRKIFEHSMKEMYEKDYTFSYLYPFSHTYYRKYGYELNMVQRSFSVPVSSLKHFEQTGEMKLCTGPEESGKIKCIYNEFIKDKNLAVVRTDRLWKHFLEKEPYKDNVFLYVWHDAAGEARGYIQYQVEKPPAGKYNFRINELVWLDRKALTGILGFMAGFSSQIDKILWRAPEFINLHTLFPEPYDVTQEIHTHGMNRIVNAEKALQAMAVPSGGGKITISVKDDFFPANTGNYTLAWEDGGHTVGRTQSPPDLSCDVQSLSQLVTGFASIGELAFAGRIAVHNNEAVLSQLFRKKPLFINNFF